MPRNFFKARRYFERAAKEPHPSGMDGDPNAMAELAQFCARGYGGAPLDLERAARLVERARASTRLSSERRALCDFVEREIYLTRRGHTCSTVCESWTPPSRACEGCGRREAPSERFRRPVPVFSP